MWITYFLTFLTFFGFWSNPKDSKAAAALSLGYMFFDRLRVFFDLVGDFFALVCFFFIDRLQDGIYLNKLLLFISIPVAFWLLIHVYFLSVYSLIDYIAHYLMNAYTTSLSCTVLLSLLYLLSCTLFYYFHYLHFVLRFLMVY